MTTTKIRRSKSYPKYWLVRHGNELHVAMKTDEYPDWDGFISVGQISHEENFETACDNAEEDFRCMLEFI